MAGLNRIKRYYRKLENVIKMEEGAINSEHKITKSFIGYLFTSIVLIAALSFIINGCDDNTTVNNNSPNGCNKVPTLVFPPNDTSIYSPTVDFRWNEPSCGPQHYKLIIYRDFFYDTILSSGTAVSRTLPVDFTYHWKVVAFYRNPVNDSAESATYDFFSQP